MMETACVIAIDGSPLYWHVPPGRTSVTLPDSRLLWEVLWAERERIGGVAHTHPGRGEPVPSHEDLTTFAALEAALGRRLDWWIATADELALFRWSGPDKLHYMRSALPILEAAWLARLRELSSTPPSGEPPKEERGVP
jgi:hypothetical protein